MIAGIRGQLLVRTAEYAVVDVHGLSLKVFASTTTLSQLANIGEEVRLFTHFVAREDNLALYGFASEPELQMFELLLTVSGVGPRAGLNILSAVPLDTLRAAIANENIDLLTKVPGIGRKTAGRLILELKGKVPATGPTGAIQVLSVEDSEVVAALTALGYGSSEAQEAVRSTKLSQTADLEERIVAALRYFSEKH